MEPAEEWSVESNEALHLTLIAPGSGEELATFHPKFTYPIYGDHESIFGYKDLRIDVLFSASDMISFVNVGFSDKVKKVGEVEAEDVEKSLKEFLPEGAFGQDRKSYLKKLKTYDGKFTPPGTLVTTYIADEKIFEIWRSNLQDPRCRELLANMQILASLYIEGGTPLDLEDEEWTTKRWDVFFLYEKKANSYLFVGYCTLYRYYFFDKTSNELSRVRLSQFLILPPWQRQGHGSRFYDNIIAHYSKSPDVREVTVEDPSEEFSDLRDIRDLTRLQRDPDFAKMTLVNVSSKKFPLEEIHKKSKMPRRQFLRCVEMELLRKLDKKEKRAYKMYRILVKTRLYKHNIDVLAQLDRLDRIDKLEQVYFGVEDDYYRLLKGLNGKHALEEGNAISSERPAKRVRV